MVGGGKLFSSRSLSVMDMDDQSHYYSDNDDYNKSRNAAERRVALGRDPKSRP